jgi:hypothetical protein
MSLTAVRSWQRQGSHPQSLTQERGKRCTLVVGEHRHVDLSELLAGVIAGLADASVEDRLGGDKGDALVVGAHEFELPANGFLGVFGADFAGEVVLIPEISTRIAGLAFSERNQLPAVPREIFHWVTAGLSAI